MHDAPPTERPLNNMLAFGREPSTRRLVNAMLATKPQPNYSATINAIAAALPDRLDGAAQMRPSYLESWAGANFGTELQKPFWTIDDAVPILLAIDPVFALPATLAKNEFGDGTAFEAMRLRRLVADAQLVGDLLQRFRPFQLINWALAQHIHVPDELLKLAVDRGLPIAGHLNPAERWKEKYRELVDRAKTLLVARDARIEELAMELKSRNEELATLRPKSEQVQKQLASPCNSSD